MTSRLNILSDRFVKDLEKKKLIPIAVKTLSIGINEVGLEDKAKEMVQESWKRFLLKYPKYTQNDVTHLMSKITKNTCLEYLRLLKKTVSINGVGQATTEGQDKVEVDIDMKYLLDSLPPNYRFIIEAEQRVSHDNQEELAEKIAKEYKKKFKVKKFNVNILRLLKSRARDKIEELMGNKKV